MFCEQACCLIPRCNTIPASYRAIMTRVMMTMRNKLSVQTKLRNSPSHYSFVGNRADHLPFTAHLAVDEVNLETAMKHRFNKKQQQQHPCTRLADCAAQTRLPG